jgi:hypothetical protein
MRGERLDRIARAAGSEAASGAWAGQGMKGWRYGELVTTNAEEQAAREKAGLAG